jgi:hypothetical protein
MHPDSAHASLAVLGVPVDYFSGHNCIEAGTLFSHGGTVRSQHLFSHTSGWARTAYMPDKLEWVFMAWQ